MKLSHPALTLNFPASSKFGTAFALSKFKDSRDSSQITKPAPMLTLMKSNIKGLYLNLLKLLGRVDELVKNEVSLTST